VHTVRTRGGNQKFRALRLDSGNFAWASEGTSRKTRILDVVYNASNNELVRTKTLVKNAIIVVDATPFKQWYEAHYLLPLKSKKDKADEENEVLTKKRSKSAMKKYLVRQKTAKIELALEEQFQTGRILGEFVEERIVLWSLRSIVAWLASVVDASGNPNDRMYRRFESGKFPCDDQTLN
jgi:small subunit ribosomal protein S8e